MRENIFKLLAATAQAMGQVVTVEAVRLMADDLANYDEDSITQSLRALRRKGGRFCLSAILDNIITQDGRPSPDRAWAMIPKDEGSSAVITQEMSSAWSVASQQYADGDKVGAQIAFKREYSSIVEKARDSNEKPSWFPSLGHDVAGRAPALIEAAENRRLSVSHVKSLLGYDSDSIKLLIARANIAGILNHGEAEKLLLEYK